MTASGRPDDSNGARILIYLAVRLPGYNKDERHAALPASSKRALTLQCLPSSHLRRGPAGDPTTGESLLATALAADAADG